MLNADTLSRHRLRQTGEWPVSNQTLSKVQEQCHVLLLVRLSLLTDSSCGSLVTYAAGFEVLDLLSVRGGRFLQAHIAESS